MKFTRKYSRDGQPYHDIKFVERTSELKNEDGSKASRVISVTVPDFWSQIATDILAQKYLRKAGVPETGMETDARQVFHRLAGCWADWGMKHKYFDTEADKAAFYDEVCYMLAHQMAAPNSPQWFNTGIFWAYGITGSKQSGYWFVDPETGELKETETTYERPLPLACFIQSVSDNLVNDGGIMDLWMREARVFKLGAGSGVNISDIRADGEPLSSGGVSSGVMSFLRTGDASAGAIKSGGANRRSARLLCLDMDHPDIEEFINWKVIEEQKVACLVAGSKKIEKALNAIFAACKGLSPEECDPVKNAALKRALSESKANDIPLNYVVRAVELAKQGYTGIEFPVYDTDWTSESYRTVSGQNANNSVRVTNDFMVAVENDANWDLRWRRTKEVARTVKARDLWNQVAYAAWNCADPGVQFDSTFNEWHTYPKDGKIRATNPCGEWAGIDNTSCNLASLNLLSFYSEKTNKFDVVSFAYAVRIWTVILDISIQMAQFPSKEIAYNGWKYRTLGLGYANIGALLMRMGLAYGSAEAVAVTGAITAILTGKSYQASAEMAAELGAFPAYQRNKDDMMRVMKNHRSAAYNLAEYDGLSVKPMGISEDVCPAYLLTAARKAWDSVLEDGERYGFRNAQASLLAPCGTIGLLLDCDTTGIEPDFSLVKYKKLAGGGYFKIINQSIPPALKKLGYSDKQISDIVLYCVGSGSLEGAPIINVDSLKAKGFTSEVLHAIEQGLPQAFDITFAFNTRTIGEDFCRNILGLSKEDLRSDCNILSALGFTDEEIAMANEYVCGVMTVEGAPHIKMDDLPVFDCANKCGRKGTRFIPVDAHLKMMAACQPFLSAAISKTVNLPYDSTVEDVKKTYENAWKMMLKGVALYRDGSKLSQPLNSAMPLTEILTDQSVSQTEQVKEVVKYVAKRNVLPMRRSGYTQKMRVGGHSVYLRTGEYPDGSLGEVFLDLSKEGTLMRSLLNSFAVSISLGLQYGVPLEEFVDVFTFTRFEPNGMVQGHDKIRMTTSIVDLIFKDLAITYLDRSDLAHGDRKVEEIPVQTKKKIALKPKLVKRDKMEEARLKGYEGDPCPDCGAATLVRNGACLKCESCGATTGCS